MRTLVLTHPKRTPSKGLGLPRCIFKNMRIFIVIPAYNEQGTIKEVILDLKKHGFYNTIVVDDGSTDNTENEVRKFKGVILLKHIINRGVGAATKTGIEAALLKNADIIVTFDADGQHKAEDIKKVIKPILKKGASAVIGSRTHDKNMPFIRIIFNKIGNILTFLMFGIMVSDSQSGLRAFSRKAAQKIKIKCNGYEVSSEIIKEIADHKLRLKEVPIQAIYTPYSLSRGQSLGKGVRTAFCLILRKIVG